MINIFFERPVNYDGNCRMKHSSIRNDFFKNSPLPPPPEIGRVLTVFARLSED